MSRLPLLLVFLLAAFTGIADAQAPPPTSRVTRLRNSLGPVLFTVRASGGAETVTFPADFVFAPADTVLGQQQRGAKVGKNRWLTGPCKDGVAVAISSAYQYRPSESRKKPPVVEVNGACNTVYVGGVGQAGATGVASWPSKQPIAVALVASADGGKIVGVNVGGALGGIEQLILCGLSILGPPGSTSALTIYQGTNTGRLELWGDYVGGADPSAWNGHGTKWPIRPHGHLNGVDGPKVATYNGATFHGDGIGGGLVIYDCVIQPGREHAYVYADNLGPNSVIDGIACAPSYDRALWVERTLIQITNRANTAGVTAGGPSGYGSLEIANIESVPCGGDPAIGGAGDGSAITIAGQLGPVWIHDIDLLGYHGGGIVVWTDAAANKGVWKFSDGFTTGPVRIENVTCESTINTNPAIAVGGARSLTLAHPFVLNGRGIAVDIDNQYVGPVATGPLAFEGCLPDVSTYGGWQSQTRVRRNGVALSAQQLDELAAIPSTTKP